MRRTQSTNISSRFAVVLLLGLLSAPAILAQEVADTIKIRTRVVFMDALVKDRKSGIPITDLKPENFELFDDGKQRTISYFNSEGQARKPLGMVLILDLRDDGAGRFLKRDEVRAAIVDELVKLPPGDEVAILAINLNTVDDKTAAIRNGKAMWLTEFTRDRAQLETALARIPALVAPSPEADKKDAAKKDPKSPDRESSASISVSSDTDKNKSDDSAKSTPQDKPKENDVLESETTKGKNGAVVTRTIRKEGSVHISPTSSRVKVSVKLDTMYDMAAASRDATHT